MKIAFYEFTFPNERIQNPERAASKRFGISNADSAKRISPADNKPRDRDRPCGDTLVSRCETESNQGHDVSNGTAWGSIQRRVCPHAKTV